MNSLTRATLAVQAMQAAQTAAHNLALSTPSAVPNGLTPGGLQVAPNAGDTNVWQGANLPWQSTSNGQTTVEIDQTQPKAILTWTTFNVGKNTEVYFNQSQGNTSAGNNWIALNRVIDPSGVPSQILGQIKAEGAVYLINQNGVIFGGSSQVNVNSLIASSLPLFGDQSTNRMVPGSAAYDAAVAASNNTFLTGSLSGDFLGVQNSDAVPLATVQSWGAVTVDAGATIATGNLGFALLAAPNVSNAGTIITNSGQIMLAAGMGIGTSTSSNTSAELQLVLVGTTVRDANGNDTTPQFTVANTGLLAAVAGNVTMVGSSVFQNGVIAATTSLSRPGSITIGATDEAFNAQSSTDRAGPIVFGPQSVTTILPDEDGETTTSSQAATAAFQPSVVSVTGGSVTFQGDGQGSGALVYAPNGTATIIAQSAPPQTQTQTQQAVPGRVYIDNGVVIDVSGLPNVELPMSANLVTIGPLTANDLADDPLQRDSFLLTQTITVDSRISGTNGLTGQAWVGTPLIDAAGYVQDMPRSIDQLMINGGTINLGGSEVITAPGSVLNLAGGYNHYLGGMVNTSLFIGADGRIYSAADANPLVPIVGFAGQFTVDHARWNVSDTYINRLLGGAYYQPDYIQGGNGGTLNIYAGEFSVTRSGSNVPVIESLGALILDGTILAGAVAGPYQVADAAMPSGGTLSIGAPVVGNFNLGQDVFYSWAIQDVYPNTNQAIIIAPEGTELSDIAPNFGAATQLSTPAMQAKSVGDPGNVLYTSTLSSTLIDAAGFSSISFTANDNAITINPGVTLSVRPGGSITLNASVVSILGNLIAPSGRIAATSTGGASGVIGPLFDPANPITIAGNITVGPGVVLSAAGQWVNDAGASFDHLTGSEYINGGSISLSTDQANPAATTGSILLEQNSLLDVSSGGYVQPNGQLKTTNGVAAGAGGSITLAADASGGNSGYAHGTPPDQPTTAQIVMDGTLRGYGFSGGGTLTLQALDIVIGSSPTAPADTPSYVLYLPASFFAGQGFGAYKLTSEYDATITAGTTVKVTEANFIPNTVALLSAPTGSNLYGAGTATPDGTLVALGQLDPYHRQATSFALTAGDYLNWNAQAGTGCSCFGAPTYPGVSGTLLLDQGAAILADAGASVTLSSYGQVTVLGNVTAPGGSIALTGLYAFGTNANRSVWLGPDSALDVSGTVLINPLVAPVLTANGMTTPVTGKVLPGGSVTIEATGGYVIAQQGGLVAASGASGVFDLAPNVGSGLLHPVAYVPTPVWSDAGQITLGATGGLYFDATLVAQGGAPQAQGGTLTLAALQGPGASGSGILNVSPTAGLLLQQSGDLVPAGLRPGAVVEPTLSTPSGIEHFAADRFDGSGITNLVLGGNPNDLTLLDAPAPLVIGFAGNVNLSLGQSFIADAANFVALPAGSTTIPSIGAGQRSVGATTISITAPYIEMGNENSQSNSNNNFTTTLALADATLDVTAVAANGAPGTIDLTGQFGLKNFAQVNFTSSGDIRLYTPATFDFVNNALTPAPGELVTAGNLTFKAADIYPATANTFIIDANTGGLTDANGNLIQTTVTLLANGSSTVPLSAGGALLIDATTIVQDGTLRAPSGAITLGVSNASSAASAFNNLPLVQTQTVTLGAGSLTSVSLDGDTVPYGATTDGIDWQYINLGTSATAPNLSAPPAKVISLAGVAVALDPGASVDLSGGGTLQAQEWVSGTGGTRNVLLQVNTNYQNGGATSVQTPLYPDDRQIYAIVPGLSSSAAPYDPEFVQPGSAVGQSVYLSGAAGLPAGVYTLLPAQYATLPGAYRVVQNTSVTNALSSQNGTLADGTDIVAGYFTNSLTGSRSAATTSFQVQSAAVWGKYSQYTLTSANTYFAALAAENGTVVPRLPADAGQLAIAAVNSLILGATIQTAAPNGRGAQIDIASQDIQIVGNGEAALPGYLQISAGALDALGAESLLIGGIRTNTSTGETIDPLANSVVVSNDGADPLFAPEIVLVTKTDPTGADPNSGNGLLVQSGSVVEARGSISASADVPITIGSSSVSGDGALLAVSNGAPVTVTRVNLPATPLGLLDVRAGATLSGGQSLILDSSGNTLVDPAAVLFGNTITANASTITFVAANNISGSGLVIGPATLAQFANANTVILQSRGAMDFVGDVAAALDHGTLDLSAGAFTTSTGGNVSIGAPTLILTNTLGAQPGTWSGPTTGSLTLNAGELDFGTGETATSTAPATSAFYGFGQITAKATAAVVAQGTGGIFDFGSAPVTLNTPLILADTGATQTLKTAGTLTLASLATAPLQRDAIGGAITLIGGSIRDGVNISAPAGNVSLEATGGDVTLASGITISVAGIAKQFYDVTEYAPGGAITLIADLGNVTVPGGATLDFAGATGGGNAGSLTISAPSGIATLQGTISGAAASGYAGGSLTLSTGGAADLDNLAAELAASGVTNLIAVTTGSGNLTLSAGNTLTAQTVTLVANGGAGNASDAANGNVNILGTINANGAAGGTINLYGKSGVDLEGSLLAEGSDPTQLGGTVNIGTTGTPTANSYNANYGYENVALANSGRIILGTNAVINVSGGSAATLAADGLIGGVVNLRTPLLDDGSVNVVINMANPAGQIIGARAVNLEAYAVWSTTDTTTGAQHFDGIIDPAGWYDQNGNLLSGTFTDVGGNTVLAYTAGSMTAAQLAPYLESDYFAPTTANTDHQTFYGYLNGNSSQGDGTLMGFISAPNFVTVANTGGIANFNEVPDVELDNPVGDAAHNSGAISVVTNWNLGAIGSSGSPSFRYNGQAPVITLRAAGNVNINASISDGFYQASAGPNIIEEQVSQLPPTSPGAANSAYASDDPKYGGYLTTVNLVGGTSYTFTASNSDYSAYAAPAAGQAQAYYNAYVTYDTYWTTWYGDIKLAYVTHGLPFVTSPVITAATAAATPQLSSYSSYASYQTAYLSYLENNYRSPTTEPPPPQAPTNFSDYTGYLSVWHTYLTFMANTVWGGRSLKPNSIFYIYAPAPPPLDPNTPVVTNVPVAQNTAGGNSPSPMPTPSNPEALAVATLAGGTSSSYQIVAGADFASTNPLATEPLAQFSDGDLAGQGSVTINGHFAIVDYSNASLANPVTVNFPTMIRSGVGSIDIAAGNNFELLDTTAPGVVYTAGKPDPNTTPSTSVSNVYANGTTSVGSEFLVTGAVNPIAGGNISITAGNDIIGQEQIYDTSGAVTGMAGVYIGQFWWPWMETGNPTVNNGSATVDISSSINFAAFDQGIMSVGGNIKITAGRNISDLSVSLPTTWYLTAPGSAAPATTFASGLTLNTVGGGNLTVSAGGDILSGDYFVSNGAGIITAGGRIGSDFTFAPVGGQSATEVSTLLALQDATMTVAARQSADIGGVYNPSQTTNPLTSYNNANEDAQTYSASSAVSVLSTTGNVSFDTNLLPAKLLSGTPNPILPAAIDLTALNGGISVEGGGYLYPSAQGQLSLIAGGSVQMSEQVSGDVAGAYLGLMDLSPNSLLSPLNPRGYGINLNAPASGYGFGPLVSLARYTSDDSLHSADPDPVRIYSLNGSIINGTLDANGFYINEVVLQPNKPALIYAGQDIVNLAFLGQNYDVSDVTRIVAGHDIYDTPLGNYFSADSGLVPVLVLAGPGTFDIEAGRNVGPLTSANEAYIQGYQNENNAPTGNPFDTGIETIGNLFNGNLPAQSANIVVLFGVGPGINTQGFADAYLDPSVTLPSGIAGYSDQLVAFVEQYETGQNQKYGTGGAVTGLTPAQAWAIFQTLPAYQQQFLIDEVFFDILNTTGLDYNQSSSPYYHQYARGYEAINTLFPASYGYTQNNLGGGSNGANALVSTGYLDMRGSTIQTQQGGNISLLGPGGEILVGSVSAPPYIVNATGKVLVGPNQQGILTLETGDIDIFSDRSLLLAQSRVFTEQGGNIVIWSSNGDINGGEGVKTTSEVPPALYTCDPDQFCTIDAKGDVTGAGIATLQTIPGAPRGNANLMAPRGTVDAGAAGIRVSGNLNIAALQVLNAFNIQVQGTTIGLPTYTGPNTTALTTANSTAGASQAGLPAPTTGNNDRPSIIIVEFIGFGGGDDGSPPQQQKLPSSDGQQGYNYDPNAPVQVLGHGPLSEAQMQSLTAEEREHKVRAAKPNQM